MKNDEIFLEQKTQFKNKWERIRIKIIKIGKFLARELDRFRQEYYEIAHFVDDIRSLTFALEPKIFLLLH